MAACSAAISLAILSLLLGELGALAPGECDVPGVGIALFRRPGVGSPDEPGWPEGACPIPEGRGRDISVRKALVRCTARGPRMESLPDLALLTADRRGVEEDRALSFGPTRACLPEGWHLLLH